MPYDEFGNYVYTSDDIALDEMKYELAKRGTMPLRPSGSDVPFLASEVPNIRVPVTPKEPPKPYSTATNFPQAVADRLGISAIPQAIMSMATGFGSEVARGMGYKDTAQAMQYQPTSRVANEVLSGLEELPRVVTGSHMGFGPLPEFYVPRRGFGLQGRPMLTPDDVRVMGGRAVETGREIRNITEDFRNAQSGVMRQNYMGEPTYGARLQGAADDIGDIMARREMQGLSPIPGIPDAVVPETRMYAVRQPNAGQMLKETDLPDIKYMEANPSIQTAGYMLEQDLPYVDEAFPNNTRSEYYNKIIDKEPDLSATYREWSDKKFMELYPDAPDVNAARDRYNNSASLKTLAQDQMRFFTEFSTSPEFEDWARDKVYERNSVIADYNEAKNKPKSELTTDEAKEANQAKVEELELEILKKDYAPELSEADYIKRITPPTAEEYMRRANAARKYILGEFRNDMAKYVGTSQGPQMELAKRGITIPTRQEILEKARNITQGGSDFRDLQKKRQEAGFNPLGEMQPLIVQKEAELAKLQEDLNSMNTKRNNLRDQHRLQMPDEPDPARNPTQVGAEYRALKNPMSSLIDKMEKTKKQIQNFELANAYETLSDMAYIPKTAEYFRNAIPYKQQDFFPDLFGKRESGEFKTPNEAPMFNLATGKMKQLGTDFLAEQYTNAMLDGRVPIDEKGKPTVSVEKFIEQITKPRLKEEELQNLEGSRAKMRLNTYAQDSLSGIPPELRFQNASALELTKDNPLDVIRRQVSFDGMVLDNCVAGCSAPHPGVNPFTGDRYNYAYPVDVATGASRGNRPLSSSYMEQIEEGKQRYASLRDNQTGLPVVNINMLRTGDSNLPDNQRKFNVQYVSGYQNDQIDKKYTNDVRDYLNARADIIQGSGGGIDKWGIFDLNTPAGKNAAGRALGVPETALSSFDLPRFVTEKDLRDLANKQPVGNTHADLVRQRNELIEDRNRLLRQGQDDEDLVNQIGNITQEIQRISTQVRNAPSTQVGTPNLFRRMTTEALTNGIGIEDGGIGPVRARVDDLLDTDFYGLRELWSDDYDFYPVALRNFINGVRNIDNLPSILTNTGDASTFANQMRERLTRFQNTIQDFTPMQRELFVRELDNYAESNINQMAENLDPENPTRGLEEIEDSHPGTIQYLRDIETRRRGQDFQPQDQVRPALGAPINVPRDIAEQITPTNYLNRDGVVQQIAERLNNSVRNLPTDRETIIEAIDQYNANPLDIPGALEMVLPPEGANENRRIISNYLLQHLQSRLSERNAERAQGRGAIGLANDIVAPNAAFRNQTVENIITGINQQLLPFIERFNPNVPGDRDYLEREVQSFQNSPLDRDLGQTLEEYIGANPNRENQIRERVAEFMIDQIQRRLEVQPQAAPQGVPPRSTAVMNSVGTLVADLFREAEVNQFEIRDLTSTLHALDARNFDHPIIRALPEADRAPAQEDAAATLRLILQNRNINIPVDIFAQEALPPIDPRIAAYRDGYTNELTGSRRAFDEVMQAERMSPGSIYTAIDRTDGGAMYRQEIMDFYRVDSPAGIGQLNNALRQYMEGNGFDVPPRPVNPIAELERRYPAREEFVYDPNTMRNEIDSQMDQQERVLTRNQYGRLEDLVQEIQRDSGENFESLIDAIDRIRMRQGVDGDVDLALGDMRAHLIRAEEAERLEFDRLQRNAEQEQAQRPVVVPPEAALRGSLDAAREFHSDFVVDEVQDLVDNIQNDDILFEREPERFIELLRDEADQYATLNQIYSDAVNDVIRFLENYMRERRQRPQGRKRGGYIKKKMNDGGKVQPSSPSSGVNDQSKPVTPVKKIINPDAPEFKDILNRERANRGSGGGSGGADLKHMMNPRNITYNAGGKVSIDQMRYELLRK